MACDGLAADFDMLADMLHGVRTQQVRVCGNTEAGRRCLAAGLLFSAVLGDERKIVQDAFGKPRLPDGRAFNLSHAGDYAVLATGKAEIGVDIERIRPLASMRIANRFFHPDECAYLTVQPDPHAAFFSIWTLKESYCKALGRGFSIPPTTYGILPNGETGARFLGKTPFRFHRYDDRFPGYCLSVCSEDVDFPETVTILQPDDAR